MYKKDMVTFVNLLIWMSCGDGKPRSTVICLTWSLNRFHSIFMHTRKLTLGYGGWKCWVKSTSILGHVQTITYAGSVRYNFLSTPEIQRRFSLGDISIGSWLQILYVIANVNCMKTYKWALKPPLRSAGSAYNSMTDLLSQEWTLHKWK